MNNIVLFMLKYEMYFLFHNQLFKIESIFLWFIILYPSIKSLTMKEYLEFIKTYVIEANFYYYG